MKEIKDKLLKGEAVQSLIMESEIKRLLEKHSWDAYHSPFHTDKISTKSRELDISARQEWDSQTSKSTCTIGLVIECKSNRDYHIVFADENFDNEEELTRIWIGDDFSKFNENIVRILIGLGFKNGTINSILEHSNFLCFKNGENTDLINPSLIPIPTFSTFRETNSDKVRDLETSVLWKASTSLKAAIDSFHLEYWNSIESILRNAFVSCEKKEGVLIVTMASEIMFLAQRYSLGHPIIVLKSNLWKLEGDDISELKFGRWVQQDRFGNIKNWVDVVRYEHKEEYFSALNRHYERIMLDRGFSRVTKR